jgi:hypothetical protein
VSALLADREGGFDPVGTIDLLTEMRNAGGRAAVWALARRDARLFDAAGIVQRCRAAEDMASYKATHR